MHKAGLGCACPCSWIPLYLQSLGSQSATGTGLLAGLPWLAAGLGGTVAGQVSERLMRAGVPRLKVRHYMHVVGAVLCPHVQM